MWRMQTYLMSSLLRRWYNLLPVCPAAWLCCQRGWELSEQQSTVCLFHTHTQTHTRCIQYTFIMSISALCYTISLCGRNTHAWHTHTHLQCVSSNSRRQQVHEWMPSLADQNTSCHTEKVNSSRRLCTSVGGNTFPHCNQKMLLEMTATQRSWASCKSSTALLSFQQ